MMKDKKKTFWSIGILFALLALLAFIYYPRRLVKFFPDGFEGAKVTFYDVISGSEREPIVLGEAEKQELKKVLESNFVRWKAFPKKYASGGQFGYAVMIDGFNDDISFLSEKIFVVNGIQYQIYGDSLQREIGEILGRASGQKE